MAFQAPPSTSNCYHHFSDDDDDDNNDRDKVIYEGINNMQQELRSVSLSPIHSAGGGSDSESDGNVEIIGETPKLMVTEGLRSSFHSLNRIRNSGISNSNRNTPFFLNSYPELLVPIPLCNERPGYGEQNQEQNVYSFNTPVQASTSTPAADVKFLRACRLNSYDGQIRAIKQGTKEQSDFLKTLAQESQKHWQMTIFQNEQINKSLMSAENAFKEIMELRSETECELRVFSQELNHLKSVPNNNTKQIKLVRAEQKIQKDQIQLMDSDLRQSIRSLEDKSADSDAKLEEYKNQLLMMQQGQESRLQLLVEKTLQSRLNSFSGQEPPTKLEGGSRGGKKIIHTEGRSSFLQKQTQIRSHSPQLTRQSLQLQPLAAEESSEILPLLLPVVTVKVPTSTSAPTLSLKPPAKKQKVSYAAILSDPQSNSPSVQLPASSSSQTEIIPVVQKLRPNRKCCAHCDKELSSSYIPRHEEKCRVSRVKTSYKEISLSVNSPAEVQASAGSSQRVLRPRKK